MKFYFNQTQAISLYFTDNIVFTSGISSARVLFMAKPPITPPLADIERNAVLPEQGVDIKVAMCVRHTGSHLMPLIQARWLEPGRVFPAPFRLNHFSILSRFVNGVAA